MIGCNCCREHSKLVSVFLWAFESVNEFELNLNELRGGFSRNDLAGRISPKIKIKSFQEVGQK